jgi:hypothetical protein
MSFSDKNLSELYRLATTFRSAITQCDPKTLYITLQGFPRGACGDAALLLAKYLENQGYGQFNYILGNRDGYSHAWIQQEDLIVDISADQFTDQDLPVIVSYDHTWHNSFHGEIEHVADFTIFDSFTKTNLSNSYDEIVSKIAV